MVLKNPGECQPIYECGRMIAYSLLCSGFCFAVSHYGKHQTEHVISCHDCFHLCPSQSAKKKNALFKLPPTVQHIASCLSKRQRAVMCLNARVAARTLPTLVPLGLPHPPRPTTVDAPKPPVCLTRFLDLEYNIMFVLWVLGTVLTLDFCRCV